MILKEIYVAWLVDKNREKLKRVPKRIYKEKYKNIYIKFRHACLIQSHGDGWEAEEKESLKTQFFMGFSCYWSWISS